MNKKEFKDVIEEKTEEAKKSTKKAAKKASAVAKEEFVKVRNITEDKYKDVQEYVKKNPEKSAVTALAIGAAAGAIIASILRRK